jgi:hypothetical protein
MAGGTYAKVPFHDSFEGEPWSAKQKQQQQQNQKQEPWGRDKPVSYSNGLVYSTEPSREGKGSANSLDKVDFLIDGLNLVVAPARAFGLSLRRQFLAAR